MFYFALAAIAVIALLLLVVAFTTKKEFKKMDEHPEDYPEKLSEEPKEE